MKYVISRNVTESEIRHGVTKERRVLTFLAGELRPLRGSFDKYMTPFEAALEAELVRRYKGFRARERAVRRAGFDLPDWSRQRAEVEETIAHIRRRRYGRK